MTKIELIQTFLAAKKRLGDANSAFDAVIAEPFPAPVDLTAVDCADLTNGEDIARHAYAGNVIIADRDDRARLLARLIAKNPTGGGRRATTGASVKFSVALPQTLVRELDAAAESLGVSRNKLIRQALEKFLKNA